MRIESGRKSDPSADIISQGSDRGRIGDIVKTRLAKAPRATALSLSVAALGVAAGFVLSRSNSNVDTSDNPGLGIAQPYSLLAVGADGDRLRRQAEQEILWLNKDVLRTPIDADMFQGDEKDAQASRIVNPDTNQTTQITVNAKPNVPSTGDQASITVNTLPQQGNILVSVSYIPEPTEHGPADIDSLLKPQLADELPSSRPIFFNKEDVGTSYALKQIEISAFTDGTVVFNYLQPGQFDPTVPPPPDSFTERAEQVNFLMNNLEDGGVDDPELPILEEENRISQSALNYGQAIPLNSVPTPPVQSLTTEE